MPDQGNEDILNKLSKLSDLSGYDELISEQSSSALVKLVGETLETIVPALGEDEHIYLPNGPAEPPVHLPIGGVVNAASGAPYVDNPEAHLNTDFFDFDNSKTSLREAETILVIGETTLDTVGEIVEYELQISVATPIIEDVDG